MRIPYGDHLGETDCSLSILLHNRSKNLYEVGSVILGLAVWDNLVKSSSQNKSLNYLVWVTTCLEDFKGKLWVVLANRITKLIAHGKLAFVHPIFHKSNFTLSEDRLAEFKRLGLVESYGLKQR